MSLSARLTFLGSLLVALFFGSFLLGRYPVPPQDVVSLLLESLGGSSAAVDDTMRTVVVHVRLPRILGAILVGGALSVSGAAYQNLFKNPLVSPGILGVSAGASFGAAMGMLASLGWSSIQAAAFALGLFAVGCAFLIGRLVGRDSLVVLVLGGMVVSALFQAFLSLIKFVADPINTLPAITFWLMGGLSRVSLEDIRASLLPVLLPLGAFWVLRWPLHALSTGEEEAATLGVPVKTLRFAVILGSTLLTAVSVSISGIIGWVGLLVPHMARALVGPSFPALLPASFLLGGAFLLLVDNLCRTLFAAEIPLGILTSLVGAPFFLVLLTRARKEWGKC
ncbi:FecCD family ABC transporter permease [Aminomonas paucivorans]|uniref:FecCD family ABC transporter permease n=1 Tax=Aminomonas paucivorans TaxID=81412 RepID=UPI0033298081